LNIFHISSFLAPVTLASHRITESQNGSDFFLDMITSVSNSRALESA